MRSHRRNLAEWSAVGAPASRSADQRFTRLARSERIRWWLRTGVLLTVIGVMLPSLAAFFFGPLVVLFAMPKGPGASNDGCWIPFVGRWPPS